MKGTCEVQISFHCVIDGGCGQHGVEVGEKLNSARNLLRTSFGDVYFVAAVVLWGIPNILAIHTVRKPRTTGVRCFMDDDLGYGWGKWRRIVVKYHV